jgi:short subunit dehydrogenase-like uncharacterized protein
MQMSDFLIYGANGYAGGLIAREAVRRGLQPVLAGRNTDPLAAGPQFWMPWNYRAPLA